MIKTVAIGVTLLLCLAPTCAIEEPYAKNPNLRGMTPVLVAAKPPPAPQGAAPHGNQLTGGFGRPGGIVTLSEGVSGPGTMGEPIWRH